MATLFNFFYAFVLRHVSSLAAAPVHPMAVLSPGSSGISSGFDPAKHLAHMLNLKHINRLTQTMKCLDQGLFAHKHSLLPWLSQERHHFAPLIS